MLEHVPPHLMHQFELYDRTPKQGITNNCNAPHRTAAIDVEGNCMICSCDGWLPISVCKIQDIDNLERIWENQLSKQIQKDVDDKKFTWCSVDSCGIRKLDKIWNTYYISINVDESCNLACPSCRKSKIYRTKGDQFLKRESIVGHLVELINKFNSPLEIMMSGNGDPFASLIYRPLLLGMEPRENIHLRLLTNGLLIKKLMPKMKVIKNINNLDISVDAGDKQTYERVRLGGKWETLIENLDYVKHNLETTVTLKFVLQKDNLNSLDNFVLLLERYQFYGNIMPIEDWGAMSDFQSANIFSELHPDYPIMKKKLDQYRNHPLLFFHSI